MSRESLFPRLFLFSICCWAVVMAELTWTNCTSPNPPNLSCTTVQVPIDWDNPGGEQVSIFVTRQTAKDPSKKIGNLYFNPGGPGIAASGFLLDLILFNVTLFPEQFDIIAPDPRGVGKSHPMKCDPKLWNERVSYQPTDEASFEALVQKNEALGASCLNLTGPLLLHMDSASVAKDFEAIRKALGDDKITYFGQSYGTVIGQAYAELYPERIRAMALDGNLDHSLSETSMLADEVYSYENEFDRFSRWCANTPISPLHGEDVAQLFDNLTTQADKTPIPSPSCAMSGECYSKVTGEEIRFNFQNALVFKNKIVLSAASGGWAGAAEYLKQAANGNASVQLSTPVAHSSTDPVFSENGIGTLCLDWNRTDVGFNGLKYKRMMTMDIAPHTKGASASFYLQAACINWPGTTQYVPHQANITGTPPILLTNAFHDPETPYVEANGLLRQFENGVLATRRGDGHTSYLLGGATYKAINHYLVTVKPPPPNTIFSS